MSGKLNTMQAVFLKQAEHAAKAAAKCIMAAYGKEQRWSRKGLDEHYSGDVVTQVDHDAQALIMQHLKDASVVRPYLDQVAFLGEEDADPTASDRLHKPFTLMVDPLDGTRGFLDRTNSFAVSIGMVAKSGTPVFGVVSLPAFDSLLVGVYQNQAHLNERVLQPSADLNDTLVSWVSEAEIFPAKNNCFWHAFNQHLKSKLGFKGVRMACLGSPVHKGCNTATSSTPALYMGLPRAPKGVSLWDLAAIASIVAGAGGWVSDVFGAELELNRAQSCFVHHRGFVFANHPQIGRAAIEAYASTCAQTGLQFP